jgi:hypothetical protein
MKKLVVLILVNVLFVGGVFSQDKCKKSEWLTKKELKRIPSKTGVEEWIDSVYQVVSWEAKRLFKNKKKDCWVFKKTTRTFSSEETTSAVIKILVPERGYEEYGKVCVEASRRKNYRGGKKETEFEVSVKYIERCELERILKKEGFEFN